MWRTNLKGHRPGHRRARLYTLVANSIPQMQSEVPKQIDMSGDITPQQLVADRRGRLQRAGGCTACHGLGTRAPKPADQRGHGRPDRRALRHRKPGMSCKDYLFESVTKPGAVRRGRLPADHAGHDAHAAREQVWAVIAFLEVRVGPWT